MPISDKELLNPIFLDGGPPLCDDDFADPFSPYDIPKPVDEIDDDTVYEITPKGVRTLGDLQIEDYNEAFNNFEADWDAKLDEEADKRWETIQRWYDERCEAREQIIEYSEIIGALIDQFELIGQKLREERSVEAAFLVEEALKLVEKVEPDAE